MLARPRAVARRQVFTASRPLRPSAPHGFYSTKVLYDGRRPRAVAATPRKSGCGFRRRDKLLLAGLTVREKRTVNGMQRLQ